MLVWIVLPIVGTIFVSLAIRPLLASRYLIAIIPFLFLGIARALRRLQRHPVVLVLLIVTMLASLSFSAGEWLTRPSKENYREAAAILEAQRKEGDGLVLAPEYVRWTLGFYYPPALRDDADRLLLVPEESDAFGGASELSNTGTVWLLARLEARDLAGVTTPVGDLGLISLYRIDLQSLAGQE